MLPGKIIGKSWDLRFRALPGELTFISQRRVGRGGSRSCLGPRVSLASAEAGASRAGQDRGRLADIGRREMNGKIGQGRWIKARLWVASRFEFPQW